MSLSSGIGIATEPSFALLRRTETLSSSCLKDPLSPLNASISSFNFVFSASTIATLLLKDYNEESSDEYNRCIDIRVRPRLVSIIKGRKDEIKNYEDSLKSII